MWYLSPAEGAVTVLAAHRAGPGGSHHLTLDDTIAIVQTLLTPATRAERARTFHQTKEALQCVFTPDQASCKLHLVQFLTGLPITVGLSLPRHYTINIFCTLR